MKKLFLKEELIGTQFLIQNNNYEYLQTCCRKFNVKYDDKNMIGYIISESENKWKFFSQTT